MKTFFYDQVTLGGYRYYLMVTTNGLAFVGSPSGDLYEVNQFYKDVHLEHNQTVVEPYANEMTEYFTGQRESFSFALDLEGTVFQRTVWQSLQDIPYGQTVTYSGLAEKMAKPKAIRAVANAVGRNPVMIAIPCHRVLGKNGTLTGFRGGIPMKQALLDLENSEYS